MAGKLKEILGREEARSISRRYFVSNGFDGVLTATGITVGSFLSGIENNFTVFQIGIGAMIGLATSGFWSVWEIERAEKLAELEDVESAMLDKLDGTEIQERKKEARVLNSFMSGLGPIIGILVPVSPFLLSITPLEATIASVGLAVALLFSFGAYMGSISGQRWLFAGARMGLAGLVVAAINVLLPG